MSSSALVIAMQPKYDELMQEDVYTQEDVKRILFAFARDLGCKWSDKELSQFVNTVFD